MFRFTLFDKIALEKVKKVLASIREPEGNIRSEKMENCKLFALDCKRVPYTVNGEQRYKTITKNTLGAWVSVYAAKEIDEDTVNMNFADAFIDECATYTLVVSSDDFSYIDGNYPKIILKNFREMKDYKVTKKLVVDYDNVPFKPFN